MQDWSKWARTCIVCTDWTVSCSDELERRVDETRKWTTSDTDTTPSTCRLSSTTNNRWTWPTVASTSPSNNQEAIHKTPRDRGYHAHTRWTPPLPSASAAPRRTPCHASCSQLLTPHWKPTTTTINGNQSWDAAVLVLGYHTQLGIDL